MPAQLYQAKRGKKYSNDPTRGVENYFLTSRSRTRRHAIRLPQTLEIASKKIAARVRIPVTRIRNARNALQSIKATTKQRSPRLKTSLQKWSSSVICWNWVVGSIEVYSRENKIKLPDVALRFRENRLGNSWRCVQPRTRKRTVTLESLGALHRTADEVSW